MNGSQFLKFLQSQFDKLLWAGIAMFFSILAVHFMHHQVVDERLIVMATGAVGAALSAIAILTNARAGGSTRSSDVNSNGKPESKNP